MHMSAFCTFEEVSFVLAFSIASKYILDQHVEKGENPHENCYRIPQRRGW